MEPPSHLATDSMEALQPVTLPTNLPLLYFNGIAVGVGSVDLSVILNHNQTPLTELKMTYAIAKNLSESLAMAVANYEKFSGQKVVGAKEMTDSISTNIADAARKGG